MSRGMIRVGPLACSEAGNWTIGIWEIDPEAIGLAALEYSRYPLSWVREGSFSVALAMIETNGFVCRKAQRFGSILMRIIPRSPRRVVFRDFFRSDPPTKISVFWYHFRL
jgi:hypothetical protein